jgi:tetratricopeptide (TPR) repeat protein
MVGPIRLVLAVAVLAVGARTSARPQDSDLGDPAKAFVPIRAQTKDELDHREALKLYGLAVFHERANRLLEATRVLEQARQLEPDAPAILRALCPLYLALDRTQDALAACRKVVELDPGDFQSWYLLARQYRSQQRSKDAIAALDRGVACAGLKEKPELRMQMYFDLAVLNESAQQYAAAEKAYREVAAVLDNPQALTEQGELTREQLTAQAADTYERLGRVCLKGGRHKEAIKAFRTAQQKDDNRAMRLAYNLAEVYEAQGKLDDALRSLDVYLQSKPQGTEAYERRITLLEKLGRVNEVLPHLQRAAEVDKFNVNLKLLLAAQYAKRGEPQNAKDIYQALLKTSANAEVYRGLLGLYDANNAEAMQELLNLLDSTIKAAGSRNGQTGSPLRAAEARAILLVLRGSPKLVSGLLTAIRDQIATPNSLAYETRYYLAVLAARANKLEEAEALYRTCLFGAGRRNEYEAYDGLIEVLFQAKKHNEIIDVCRQGLQTARGTSRELFDYNMARAYSALDKMEQALEAATNAVDHAQDQNRLMFRRYRAQLLAQAERYDQAIEECQALLKEYRQPGDVRTIRYVLSSVYSAAKKQAQAEEQLQAILEQDPNDATANNDLGYMWADEGKNLEEAERMIRKALELDRKQRTSGTAVSTDSDHDNGAYLDSLGWVLFRRGKLAEARKELEKAVAAPDGKDDPVVWDHLGDVCFRAKDTAAARKAWERAAALYDDGKRRKSDDRYKDIQEKLKLPK